MPDGFRIGDKTTVTADITKPFPEMKEGAVAVASKRVISEENLAKNIPFPEQRLGEISTHAPESFKNPELHLPLDAPSEVDKKDFMRKVFAGKRYQRTYKLYGGAMTIKLEDRSTVETEMMYSLLDSDKYETEEEFATQLDRYLLALQFRNLDVKGEQVPVTMIPLDVSESETAQREALKQRVEQILQLPKPTYMAIMEANRRFEEHVQYLTERALNTDFWKTGGDA